MKKERLGGEFYYIPEKIYFLDILNKIKPNTINCKEIGITALTLEDITGADVRRARQRGWELGDTVLTADSATVLARDVEYIEVRRPGTEDDPINQAEISAIIYEIDDELFLAESPDINKLPSLLTELTVKRGKSIWKTTNAGRNWELIVGSGKRWMDGNELKAIID